MDPTEISSFAQLQPEDRIGVSSWPWASDDYNTHMIAELEYNRIASESDNIIDAYRKEVYPNATTSAQKFSNAYNKKEHQEAFQNLHNQVTGFKKRDRGIMLFDTNQMCFDNAGTTVEEFLSGHGFTRFFTFLSNGIYRYALR
eukprot:CAMPEP_0116006056 /NCGR_PEP_ID=MMETSP0321-20121206/1510_1 /TAXON_ID=163516 /ORGANISM="Leptocylindrus danicus var. danicus, Strain B650" /LENGTH=142 /DNA_ID=CAMNT_0003474555 /DNA_START=25 /DNA_END=453 /DNA_ORIENTATION=-